MKLSRSFANDLISARKKLGTKVVGVYGYDAHITDLFNPLSKRGAIRSYEPQQMDVFPEVMSLDPHYLSFLEEMYRSSLSIIKPEIDDLGRVRGKGVRSDLSGLLHLGGVPQARATVPNIDNKHLREQKGLVNTWQSEFHKNLFRSVVRCFFSQLPNVNVRIKDRTSIGFPSFDTDVWTKSEKFIDWMQPVKMEQMIKLVMDGKFEEGYRKFGWFGPAFTLFRDQASDKVVVEKGQVSGKERSVSDLMFGLTGGRDGKILKSSKDPSVWGLSELSGRFVCQRRRVAYAQSGGYSYWLLPFAQSIRSSVYHRYEFTMHHTTREQKRVKFSAWDKFIAVDVSDHDILWPVDLYVPEIADVLRELGYEPFIVELFVRAIRTAIYVPTIAPGEGGFMVGDWRDPANSSGLPSGNPFTDILGAIGMIFVYCLAQLEHTMQERVEMMKRWSEQQLTDWMDSYLSGNEPIGAPSKSDDAFLVWKSGATGDARAASRVEDLHRKMKDDIQVSPYMLLSYEHGGAFLGDVAWFGGEADLKNVEFIGNATSLFVKQFLPEYAIKQSVGRDFYERDRLKMRRMAYRGIAHLGRAAQYGSIPIYSEMIDIISHAWKKHMMPTLGQPYIPFMEDWARRDQTKMLEDIPRRMKLLADKGMFHGMVDPNTLTPLEIEFLNNPDVADYKARDGDIRPTILAMSFGMSEQINDSAMAYLDTINPTIRRSHVIH